MKKMAFHSGLKERRRKHILILLLFLLMSACGPTMTSAPVVLTAAPTTEPSATPLTAASPTDRFAGTWSGTMSFSDDANRKEDVIVTILAGCVIGEVCGSIENTTVICTWEMKLESKNDNVFEYTFSKTMSGECPALGGGTLTLQSDGTLIREHVTPNWIASGTLEQ